MSSSHIRERGFVEPIDALTRDGQPLRVVRPGFVLKDPFPGASPPPVLGADTERWMQTLGFTPAQIAEVTAVIEQAAP
jgi:hypothetical protein